MYTGREKQSKEAKPAEQLSDEEIINLIVRSQNEAKIRLQEIKFDEFEGMFEIALKKPKKEKKEDN